jgi:hypothetical protein
MSAVRCKNWEIESLVLGGLAYQLIWHGIQNHLFDEFGDIHRAFTRNINMPSFQGQFDSGTRLFWLAPVRSHGGNN